jgi:hypothetical protein
MGLKRKPTRLLFKNLFNVIFNIVLPVSLAYNKATGIHGR